MRKILRNALVYFASALMALTVAASAQAAKIRIALAETPSDELAAFFVALDRAKANGLEYEWTAFSDEELAIQAILSGQMDIGFGTPYSVMQKSKAPIRIIYQLSKLKFFPVTYNLKGNNVALATAHPCKFPDAIKRAINLEAELPKELSFILAEKENYDIIENNLDKIKQHIKERI